MIKHTQMLNPIVQSQFNGQQIGQLVYPAYPPPQMMKIPMQNPGKAAIMQTTFTNAKPLITKQMHTAQQNQMINSFFN